MVLRRSHLALSSALLLGTLAGCSEGVAEVRTEDIARSIREEQLDQFLDRFAAQAAERAASHAEEHVVRLSLWERLDQGLDFVDDARRRDLILAFYAARDRQPLLFDGHQLNDAGRAAFGRLQDAWQHGLDPQSYGVAELNALIVELESAHHIEALREQLVLTDEERRTLRSWLGQQTGLDETLPTDDAVFQRLTAAEGDNPVPRLREAILALADARSARSAAGPELELRLLDGLLRYAVDNRYGNLKAIPETVATERGWNIDRDDQRDEIVATVLAEALAEAAQGDFVAWVGALQPQHPQYDGLLAGVLEYIRYIEAGGWDEVSLPEIGRVGATHAGIPALRRRLAAENYFSGDLTSTEYDRELRDAVRAYQHTHQLVEDGTFRDEVQSSLNLTAERRLAQIFTGMDRWRNAASVRDAGGEFIWVNIPDFHAELWDGGERIYRWRVIVGRTIPQRQGSRTVIRGRTPEFSNRMRYIVFNPYWNVPLSIRRTEYDHLIAEDPNWLFDNGFEIVDTGNGNELLRQVPGPSNALGRVKFLFPNEHDVYLHDTPNRRLFDRTIRAFSHGCVRVHEPMELARLLISRDRDWSMAQTDSYIERMMSTGTEQWMSLRRLVPIHLEYFPVRANDDGRIEFLADIYRYDRDAWEEREAWVRERWQPLNAPAPLDVANTGTDLAANDEPEEDPLVGESAASPLRAEDLAGP